MARASLERYSLVGSGAERAVTAGLSGVEWFRSEIPRKRMKQLMRRSNQPAIRDTSIWLGGMVVGATGGVLLWGHWLALPFFLMHGLLYASASDSRWHETGHGTPFRTRWCNEAVYRLASFLMMRDPVVWRWSHSRHHTDTLIVGRDPEIDAMRPARLARLIANLFGLVDVPIAFRDMAVHASGRLLTEEHTYIPQTERAKVYWMARMSLLIYALVGIACALTGSILPVLVIGGPRVYATFMHVIYALTQHAGLGENVIDHRLNTRTVRMNRVNRFLYWNMNYHVEHHMFPMVPYHRLPELHAEIAHDLAPPYPSIWAAYRELVPAVLRQLKDQSYFVKRELPEGAAPFHGPVDGVTV
jgi:fatty acid desaturase